ncbi:hypothetical protein B0H15DRAFT_854182 [Mycena belliarum]|uniref:F-box domain-containing protein n=1 Tax=Mycena belliarum TaxID=1033014 RepID=A0AAD6TY17_9AGAR|nr:hypothetical protein B0H15DRAFT_854182 [Mycena belliae]
MVQFWKLVNIDKRRTFGEWRDMGEWFFTAESNLAPCLSGIPQLADCDKVFRPFEPGAAYCYVTGDRRVCFPQTAARSPNPLVLLNLPTEIIFEISSHLGDMCDLVCLSMTCQVLWEVGRHELHRRLALMAASYAWAGDRIICVGDYLENAELPENLLTLEEEVALAGGGTASAADEDVHLNEEDYSSSFYEHAEIDYYNAQYFPPKPKACTLYKYPFVRQPTPGFNVYRAIIDSGVGKRLRSGHADSLLVFYAMSNILRGPNCDQPKCPLPSVLRNLTKCHYVQESVLTSRAQDMPHVKDISLGNIVLSHICFSSFRSLPTAYDGEFHHGVWAGDRFDIVSSAWLEKVDEMDGWTDVSDEAIKEMEAIWKSRYVYVEHHDYEF